MGSTTLLAYSLSDNEKQHASSHLRHANNSGEGCSVNIKGYGFWQIIYLTISLVCTKIAHPTARLIRLPFYFRVRGKLTIGRGLTVGRSLRIDVHPGGNLLLGSNIQINDNCQIACAGRVAIGNDVLIASKVFITDHDHDLNDFGLPTQWALKVADVTIHDACWLGNGVHILKGVSIGKGSVVGAGSVVTRSFPDFSIIVGIPAKLIGRRLKSDSFPSHPD